MFAILKCIFNRVFVSLKVVRKTPAIVITLRVASSGDKETSEQSSLPVDATVDSSKVEKIPEISSIDVVDEVLSEKTPTKSTSTPKRTKKSKSSRKST